MATTVEINTENLDSGKIRHTGWLLNGKDGHQAAIDSGVNVTDFFDANGKFLGADDNGLEPVFEVAAQ